LLTIILVASLALVGCQTLGDRLSGKYQDDGGVSVNQSAEEASNTNVPQNQEAAPVVKEKINHIFFGSTKYDPETKNCAGVYWVHIAGEETPDVLGRNLNLLLAGPTDKWSGKGYFSSIPTGTKLNWSKVEGDTVYADFSQELNNTTGGCASTMAYKQIEFTAKYAAEAQTGQKISKVVISVEGDTGAKN